MGFSRQLEAILDAEWLIFTIVGKELIGRECFRDIVGPIKSKMAQTNITIPMSIDMKIPHVL